MIVFDVQAADSHVQVAGDGFPLRIGDQTLQVSESQIQALKLQGFVESWESRTSPMSPEQLDPALIARARKGAGLAALSDEEYLLELHARGANSFHTLPDVYTARSNSEQRNTHRVKQNADQVLQNANQGGQPAILPRQIRTAIADLTLRPRKEQLRQVILAVCAFREWTTPAELAIWLDSLPDNLTGRHLSPMAERQAFDVCCQPDRSGVCCQQGTRHAQQIRLTMVFRTDSAVRSNGSESH